MFAMRFARPRLVLLLVILAIVFYETYAFFLKTEGEPGFLPTGSAMHATREIGQDGPLVLEFMMRSDGMDAVAVYPRASDAAPEGTVTFTLSERIFRHGLPAELVSLAPRIDQSSGRRYRLEIAVAGARPGHGLRFDAGWPVYGDARMLIGEREEWGDLKFHAEGQRTTIAKNVARLRRTAPAYARSSLFWGAGLLLLTWSLIIVARDFALDGPGSRPGTGRG
jgi:hypothetical protein